MMVTITNMLLLFSLFINNYDNYIEYVNSNTTQSDSIVTVKFSAVGDIMCHSTQFNYSRLTDSTFDFKPVYREIKMFLDSSDVVIGNLETIVAGKDIEYSGYPVFNTPEEFLEGLKYAGFDILVTANNHAFDQKEIGVLNTLGNINKNGMMSSGTYYSQEDRESISIYNYGNFNFALLSYSYGVNKYKIPDDKKYLVNIIDTALIREDINLVKERGIDLVIVYFQFGGEYEREPNEFQKEIVNNTISSGADIILGAHTHVIQPIEQFKTANGNIDSGFVAYSLGNFISNQRWRYSDGGTILNFTLAKNLNSGKVELTSVEYLPIWVFKGITEYGYEYIVLPSEISRKDSLPNYLTEKDIELMNQCFEDTRAILEKNYSGINMQNLN